MKIADEKRTTHRREVLLAATLLAAAAGAILIVSHGVIAYTPLTTDEHSFLFQSHMFMNGQLSYPYPGDELRGLLWHPQSMNICDRRFGWFSRYPPGHAFWLAPGVAVGHPWLMPWIAGILSLWCIGVTALRLGLSRPLTLFCFLCSPFFIFSHATLLSHTTALLATSAMLYAYVSWQKRCRIAWAGAAGLCWGYLYLTRPFPAALIGLCFGLHSIGFLIANRRDRRAWSGTILFAVCAACGVFTSMAYHAALLGDPFATSYLSYRPHETPGFGPLHMGHSMDKGWHNLIRNLGLWDRWMWGIPGSLGLLVVMFAVGWNKSWSPLFLGAFVSVWVGYFFFHYPGPSEVGPGYYLEVLPFAVLGVAFGAQRVWREWIARRRWKIVAPAALAVLLISSSVFSARAASSFRTDFRERIALLRFARAHIPRHSVILFDPLGIDKAHDNPDCLLMFYPDGLHSDAIFVPNRPGAIQTVARSFPDRALFAMRADSVETLRLDSLRTE